MKRMIYIAGPISKGDLATNINRATAAFRELAEAGFAPWCPQWSCFSTGALISPLGGQVYAFATAAGCDLSHGTWLAIDKEFVRRSDAVLRLSGESAGADEEVQYAQALGIPVFGSLSDLLAWANEGRDVVTC